MSLTIALSVLLLLPPLEAHPPSQPLENLYILQALSGLLSLHTCLSLCCVYTAPKTLKGSSDVIAYQHVLSPTWAMRDVIS